jgi:acetoin utilization deacetylase AcuC-like enzyme
MGTRKCDDNPCVRLLFNESHGDLDEKCRRKRPKVALIHHDDMQLHIPPRYREIYELPRRVIAIENHLKGLEVRAGFPHEGNFGGRMQLLPSCCVELGKPAVAFGSPAPKKRRRVSYSTGPCEEGSAWDDCRIVEAPIAPEEELLLVHSKRHIAEITKACELAVLETAAFQPLSPAPRKLARLPSTDEVESDVYYSPHSLIAFRRAAGGAVEAVRQLFQIDEKSGQATGRSDLRASFAIVRPPGHHCCSSPSGFCFFNNSAVAASYARKVLGISRVAIVDWDYHHGDGTQTVFYEDPSVLTISLHVASTGEGMAFPNNEGMGLTWTGRAAGSGYNINVPWPHDGVGAAEYTEAFQTIVVPALRGFEPELIIVAAGFDAVAGDMLAGTHLQPQDFYDLTKQLLDLELPTAIVLEGGYSPSQLAESSLNVVHALLGRSPPKQKSPSPATLAKVAQTGRGPGADINPSIVMDVIRRHLNTLPPWRALGCPKSDCECLLQQVPPVICTKGHALVHSKERDKHWACDECHSEFESWSDAPRFRCASCDFDLCESCYISHLPSDQLLNPWACDGCQLVHESCSAAPRFRCDQCDFDLCQSCHSNSMHSRCPSQSRSKYFHEDTAPGAAESASRVAAKLSGLLEELAVNDSQSLCRCESTCAS